MERLTAATCQPLSFHKNFFFFKEPEYEPDVRLNVLSGTWAEIWPGTKEPQGWWQQRWGWCCSRTSSLWSEPEMGNPVGPEPDVVVSTCKYKHSDAPVHSSKELRLHVNHLRDSPPYWRCPSTPNTPNAHSPWWWTCCTCCQCPGDTCRRLAARSRPDDRPKPRGF